MPHQQDAPSVQRSPFDRWLWERNINNVEAGRLLKRSAMTIGRWRAALSDPRRRIPDEESMRLIVTMIRWD